MGYSANPFRLQNALHSAPKLRFSNGGRLGLLPQTLPEGDFPSDSLLPLRGGLKGFSFKNVGYSVNPFRLQNALHSAPKLLFLRWGLR